MNKKKYSAILYEIAFDPYTLAAFVVKAGKEIKNKLFGKNEKTTSSSSSTKKDSDKSDIKSNTKNDSKSTPFKDFENSFLKQETDPNKVLKYIYLKAAYENPNFSLENSTQEIFKTFKDKIVSIEENLYTIVSNTFKEASYLTTPSLFQSHINKIISDRDKTWIQAEIKKIQNKEKILQFLNK